MTNRMDANSMRVRNIRAHIREGLEQYRNGGFDWTQLSRFLTPQQQADWRAAAGRTEKVRREQQDARFLAAEAGQTQAQLAYDEGSGLLNFRNVIMRERAKFRTYTSTNESRKRVLRRKLRRRYMEYLAEAKLLSEKIKQMPEEAWEYFKPASNKFKWLIEYKSDVEIAFIPHEILRAEQYALLEAWIAECTELIDNYESALAGSSIR